MKKILTLSLLCFLLIACESYSQKTILAPSDFEKELSQNDVQLLDVRTAGEFQSGHLKNALQANWNNKAEFKDRTSHLDIKKPVLVYCAAGSRSSAAGDWLMQQGFKVKELKGGIISWKQSNKPVAQSSNEKPITATEYKVLTNLAAVVLIDFGADWCPPCIKMEPVIEQLKKDLGDKYTLVKVDAGVQTELMKQVNVESIPTFIIYKNGSESWRKTGIVDINELKQKIQ